MLEYIVFGVPAFFTASLLGFFAVTDPIEATVDRVGVAETYASSGYSEEHMRLVLHGEIESVAGVSGTWAEDKRVRVAQMTSGIEALATSLFSLNDVVDAGLRALDIIDYIVEVDFATGPDSTIVAYVQFRDAFSGNFVAQRMITVEVGGHAGSGETVLAPAAVHTLISEVAHYIVRTAEPYLYAAYLYGEVKAGRIPVETAFRFVDDALNTSRQRDRPWLQNLQGLLAAETGVSAFAVRSFAHANDAAPRFAAPLVNWGRLWVAHGDHRRAIDLFRRSLEVDASRSTAYVDLAEALTIQGEEAEALDLLETAEAIEPDYARIYDVRSRVFRTRGEIDQAERELRRAERARRLVPNQLRFEPF